MCDVRGNVVKTMFFLPPEVVGASVLPFLSVRDLQHLDTALTNKTLRCHLNSFFKCYYYECEKNGEVNLREIQWLYWRGISIASITLKRNTASATALSLAFIASNIPKLKRCNVWCNGTVDDSILQLVQGCPDLEEVRLLNGSYTDNAITALSQHCPLLRTLYLHSNSITDVSIQALCHHCPNLRFVSLYWCLQLTDASLLALGETYSHLQSIDITGCYFSNDALISFAECCHDLRSIALSCEDITGNGLAALWTANPNIREVRIIDSDTLADSDIILLSHKCSKLQELCIKWCRRITDDAVVAVAEHCPELKSIDVSYCCQLSNDALIALSTHSRKLESINISGIRAITLVGVDALVCCCPLLRVFLGNFEYQFELFENADHICHE